MKACFSFSIKPDFAVKEVSICSVVLSNSVYYVHNIDLWLEIYYDKGGIFIMLEPTPVGHFSKLGAQTIAKVTSNDELVILHVFL